MNYGKVFKNEREGLGLSQREMAKRLGITPVSLWKIEVGRTIPKQKTIECFCSTVGIPTAFFYQLSTTIEDYKFPETE